MSIQDYIVFLQKRTRVAPGRADGWYRLALMLCLAGKHREALGAVDAALKINPQYTEAGVTRCFLLARLRKKSAAFLEFRRFFARSPEDFGVVFPLGVFCMLHGWKNDGLSLLKRAEAMRPEVPYVLLHTAAALLDCGDTIGARIRTEKAAEIIGAAGVDMDVSPEVLEARLLKEYCRWSNPSLAKQHIFLSEFQGQRGNVEAAREGLLRGNSLFPGHGELMAAMSRLSAVLGDADGALRWLRAAVAMDPGCHHAHFELSFLHAEQGNLEEALRSLCTAVDLRPLFPDYRYQLGILLLDLKRTREAIEQFERVLAVQPSSGHCALHLAAAHLEEGAPRKGLAVLADSSLRNIPDVVVLAAKAYLARGQIEEMEMILERILASDYCNRAMGDILESLRSPGTINSRSDT